MKRAANAGFTLIELLIVVAIVGILAAIAVPAFIGQVQRSRMLDAHRALNDIRRAEATYYGHYGQYCATPWNPGTVPSGTALISFASQPAWNLLGFNPDGPQRFRYRVLAGTPAEMPPAPGFSGDEYWYVVQAEGDLDADGVTVAVEGYSESERFYVSRGVGGPYLAQGWE